MQLHKGFPTAPPEEKREASPLCSAMAHVSSPSMGLFGPSPNLNPIMCWQLDPAIGFRGILPPPPLTSAGSWASTCDMLAQDTLQRSTHSCESPVGNHESAGRKLDQRSSGFRCHGPFQSIPSAFLSRTTNLSRGFRARNGGQMQSSETIHFTRPGFPDSKQTKI